MDNFFYHFMDTMPVFVCVADKNTKAPVYYNFLAADCLGNLSESERIDFIKDVLKSEDPLRYYECNKGAGSGYWFYMDHRPCTWMNGDDCILITGTDHSRSVTIEDLLKVESFTDSLTGIFNRSIGLDMLTKVMNELKAGTMPYFTISYFDLNDLEYVNDRMGSSEGDKYILTVAELVKKSIRNSDIFARMGGDEFMLIFPKCKIDVVTSALHEVSKMLDEVNNNSKPRTYYSISYGILEVEENTDKTVDSLLSSAIDLMQMMKNDYKELRTLPN